MSEVVREDIVLKILNADVPWFTLFEDGTRDHYNVENVSIGIRYVHEGQVYEYLIDIETTLSADAKTMTDLTMEVLRNNGLDPKRLISQCYDGASVMSGRKGGVQALIQEKLQRKVPYVHCFNHRLHLVVVKVISEVRELKQFFDQCRIMHSFMNHHKVISIYKGTRICRLLDQRWSGHLKITQAICSNYQYIIEVLREVQCSKEFPGDLIVQSTGLLTILIKLEYRFCLIFMKTLLLTLDPAYQVLQTRNSGFKIVLEIINSVFITIKMLQGPDPFTRIFNEVKNLLEGEEEDMGRPVRRKRPNSLYKDCILTEETTTKAHNLLESLYTDSIDITCREFESRFFENNMLLQAIDSIEDFNYDKLYPLSEFGITLPS